MKYILMIYPDPKNKPKPNSKGQDYGSHNPMRNGPFHYFNKGEYYALESYSSLDDIPQLYIDHFLNKDDKHFDKKVKSWTETLLNHGVSFQHKRKQTSMIVFDALTPESDLLGDVGGEKASMADFYQEVRKRFRKHFKIQIRENKLTHLIQGMDV